MAVQGKGFHSPGFVKEIDIDPCTCTYLGFSHSISRPPVRRPPPTRTSHFFFVLFCFLFSSSRENRKQKRWVRKASPVVGKFLNRTNEKDRDRARAREKQRSIRQKGECRRRAGAYASTPTPRTTTTTTTISQYIVQKAKEKGRGCRLWKES